LAQIVPLSHKLDLTEFPLNRGLSGGFVAILTELSAVKSGGSPEDLAVKLVVSGPK